MGNVTIASPFEVWSRGMQTVLRDNGLEVMCRDGDPAWSCQGIPQADLLILAWRYVSRLDSAGSWRLLDQQIHRKVILVLEPDDEFTAEDFVAIKVEGLILSTASAQEFSHCISCVCEGGRWVDPDVRVLLGRRQQLAPHWEDLSSREREVARLAASGLSNKHIARELDLSDGTVKMHIHHILAKLRLGGRIELTRFAEPRLAPHANGHVVLDPAEDGSATRFVAPESARALAGDIYRP